MFWKIKRLKGWGDVLGEGLSEEEAFQRSPAIIFTATNLGEHLSLRPWNSWGFSEETVINLKDLLKSQDFGVSDLLREWSGLIWFGALFSLLSVFLRQEQEERWSCCWLPGRGSKQTEHLPACCPVGFELCHCTWLSDVNCAQQRLKCVNPFVNFCFCCLCLRRRI